MVIENLPEGGDEALEYRKWFINDQVGYLSKYMGKSFNENT
jgi:hypothetical protein